MLVEIRKVESQLDERADQFASRIFDITSYAELAPVVVYFQPREIKADDEKIIGPTTFYPVKITKNESNVLIGKLITPSKDDVQSPTNEVRISKAGHGFELFYRTDQLTFVKSSHALHQTNKISLKQGIKSSGTCVSLGDILVKPNIEIEVGFQDLRIIDPTEDIKNDLRLAQLDTVSFLQEMSDLDDCDVSGLVV